MNLIDNWRRVATTSWSSRLTWLAAALSGLEVALPYVQALMPTGYIPQGRFASIAVVVSACAGLARLVAQPSLHTGADRGHDT